MSCFVLSDKIYITPSGVHKERILPEDLFVMTPESTELEGPPAHKGYKQSQCTPLFFNAYSLRGAGAVIHTHSIHAVITTILLGSAKEWRITHQEMIKGIRVGSTKQNYRYFDELVVPIIENTAEEEDLKDRMAVAMKGTLDAQIPQYE